MLKKGFSLFEIIVSLIILSIAITGMVVLFTSSKKFILHGRSTFAGTELGRVFLDPLQADVRWDTWGNNCVSTNGVNTNCSPDPQVINGISYTPAYTKTQVGVTNATSLCRVTLNLNWTEPNP